MTKESAAFVGCCILAASLVAGSAFYQGMPDPDHYRVYAEKYANYFFGHGHAPDCYRPPLYPVLLAPIVHFAGRPIAWIIFFHILLTIALLAATWRIARTFAGSAHLPLAACLFVAVDPILVFQSGQVMTETVFTAILMWTILPWLGDQKQAPPHPMLTGLLVGLGFLTRSAMAPLFAGIGVAQAVHPPRRRAWVMAAVVAAALSLPWAIRNKEVLGETVFTTTHGGYTLWLGNNASFFEYEVVGRRNWAGSAAFDRWQDRNRDLTAGESELGKDAYFRSAALRWMHEHPTDAFQSALYRLSMFWGLTPRTGPSSLRLIVGVYYGVFFALAATGWIITQSWRGSWLAATLVVVALSLVHTIYWSNMRFRAPLEPLLAIWAAVAVDCLWRQSRPAT